MPSFMQQTRPSLIRPNILRPIGFLVLIALVSGVGAAPELPALTANHGLNEALTGRLLIDELRCAACHDGLDASRMKAAPDLTAVGSRITPGYLERFLADPAAAHPGTTMPDLLGDRSPDKRRDAAEALANYLITLTDARATATAPAPADVKAGDDLFHRIGCIACHDPTAGKGLAHVKDKYTLASMQDFLLNPLKVRPSGRMPHMKLTPDEARQLASYLVNPQPAPIPEVEKRLLRTRVGKGYFKKLNCAACHQLGDHDPKMAIPAAKLRPDRGCLSATPGDAPDFNLSDSQRQAIRTALAVIDQPLEKAIQIHLEFTRFNCTACHQRDTYGGVPQHLDKHFHTTEEGLGNEARIPPPLTNVGAKLRPEWLHKVLFEAESIRPYMHVRMPQFGAGLGDLAAYLTEVDTVQPAPIIEPEGKQRRAFRDAGHLLVGDKGLNCIACHNFNGQDSPGFKGLDLMTSYQRLQPDWFVRYMKTPGAFRPGIVMPSYWPGGKAVQTEILDGDTALQLGALWHYFSLGRSVGPPSGINTPPTDLIITDEPVTYRGRSRDAGYRGIAVGFPAGIHFAFNAEYGTLTAVWKGEFATANWRGQGAGDFRPRERTIPVAPDVSFLQLPNAEAPWPIRPKKTKEQPTNPDPLYPKKHGYRFTGYFFDDNRVPTFTYKLNDVAIADRTIGVNTKAGPVLRRTLSFDSPTATTVHFRAAAGAVKALSETQFEVAGKLTLTIPESETMLRPSSENNKEFELVLVLNLPAGKSDLTIQYDVNE